MKGLLLALFLCLSAAAADLPPRAQFEKLAAELAVKVNLFHDAWAQDPDAEFYGGTTRDYLYWLVGQLKSGKTPAELRSMKIIDVRDFIIGESDVDIVSRGYLNLSPADYGVKKIDTIDADRFDNRTEAGKNELGQGFIPVEKIRLGKQGFKPWKGVGDGVGEIHSGNVTVHFAEPEEFEATHYAKQKLNHPVLLALRYLRLVAIDYYKRHGRRYPDTERLLKVVDPAVRDVIRGARLDGYPSKFWEWANGTIKKAFLSYTNPTAAKVLFDSFGVPELIARHEKLAGYNQFLFSRYPDPEGVEKKLEQFDVDKAKFYEPVSAVFPNGRFYHGTRTDEAFRAILFQGILPSADGAAGGGLYGVSLADRKYSEDWGGAKERLVSFNVSPNAKIVDITTGEGKRVFEAFGRSETAFAEAFGVDIVRYPYSVKAFVVKNSDVLSQAEGENVALLPLSKLIARAEAVKDPESLAEFLRTLKFNHVTTTEMSLLLEILGGEAKALRDAWQSNRRIAGRLAHAELLVPALAGFHPELDRVLAEQVLDAEAAAVTGGKSLERFYGMTRGGTWTSQAHLGWLKKIAETAADADVRKGAAVVYSAWLDDQTPRKLPPHGETFLRGLAGVHEDIDEAIAKHLLPVLPDPASETAGALYQAIAEDHPELIGEFLARTLGDDIAKGEAAWRRSGPYKAEVLQFLFAADKKLSPLARHLAGLVMKGKDKKLKLALLNLDDNFYEAQRRRGKFQREVKNPGLVDELGVLADTGTGTVKALALEYLHRWYAAGLVRDKGLALRLALDGLLDPAQRVIESANDFFASARHPFRRSDVAEYLSTPEGTELLHRAAQLPEGTSMLLETVLAGGIMKGNLRSPDAIEIVKRLVGKYQPVERKERPSKKRKKRKKGRKMVESREASKEWAKVTDVEAAKYLFDYYTDHPVNDPVLLGDLKARVAHLRKRGAARLAAEGDALIESCAGAMGSLQ